MTAASRHVRTYRMIVALYPKSFRREYGDDMVQLFSDLLGDQQPRSVWTRTLRDAATSIPTQRLESAMSRPSARSAGIGAVASLVLAFTALLVGGTNLLVFSGLIAVLLPISGACLLYWRANRSYIEPSEQMHEHWWKCLLAGGVCLGGLVLGDGLTDIQLRWEILVGFFLTGWALVGIGTVLGVWRVAYRMRATA